jgi:hypothetical protein
LPKRHPNTGVVNILFSAIEIFTDNGYISSKWIIMDLKHHRSNAITDTGRLMKAADNVFLDVNDV